jgi:hypothetical protein
MDSALAGHLASWLHHSAVAASALSVISLVVIVWAGGNISAAIVRTQSQALSLHTEITISASSSRLIKLFPPLTWASTLALLRDRTALALVGSGLFLLATVTAAARLFHNASGVAFVILFSPYLYALLASIWMSRLRAYIGRGRIDIYSLPVPPLALVLQQGLALSLLLSLGGIILAAGQSIYLGQHPALNSVLQQLALFMPLFAGYYLISCLFARHAKNFTVNSLIDVITMLVTFIVVSANQYLLQNTHTGALLIASCGLVAVPLALALLNEHWLVLGSN